MVSAVDLIESVPMSKSGLLVKPISVHYLNPDFLTLWMGKVGISKDIET